MRIRSITMRGYGRFADREIHFAPGLQIVMGPNERGKSTIRSFIADMIYGQKVNDTQRVFEESNELRKPWDGNGHYGGSLVYELDDGRAFEVVRNFDRHHEKIQVFDHTTGEEITGNFKRFRNRELDFGRQHLGLSKDVFLNTATISHVTLDELGDREALDEIREKLLALTDTGGGSGTVDCAMRLLSERVAAIGMSGATSKPLAQAHRNLRALEAEYRSVAEAREELATMALERRALVERCRKLREERARQEAALTTLEQYGDQERLTEAVAMQEQIDEATRQCLACSHARDVSVERDNEIQAAREALQTAERQLANTLAQKESLDGRLRQEGHADGESPSRTAPEFPARIEKELSETLANRVQLNERIAETEALVQTARDRIDEVRKQLEEMPDFSRLAADPVEWLSQLASSFSVALRARDEECALRAELRAEVASLEKKNRESHRLFEGHDDFPELAREYALQLRLHDSQKEQHASTLHSLQGTYTELQGEARAFLPIGGACMAVALVTGGAHFFASVGGMIVPMGVAGLVGLIFVAMWATHRSHMQRLNDRIEDAREALGSVSKSAGNPSLKVIDDMLRDSRLDSIRELEAVHDQYRSAELELKLRRERLVSQEEKALEAEERIPLLLERFRDTFTKAGEEIAGEGDVQDAAGRAIARYQEYRETKRRATTNRSVLERHETELSRLKTLAEQSAAVVTALEDEARTFIAEQGLLDVNPNQSAQELIADYRSAMTRKREVHGRQELLEENLRDLQRQIAREQEECDARAAELNGLLRPFGVDSIDGWDALLADARTYQEAVQERRRLEEASLELLGADSLAALQARVERAGALGERPEGTREALREAINHLNEKLEAETNQEHALHVRLTEQSNSIRPMCEIEEEQAVLHRKIRALEAEGEATSYAMALMEDVARDTHAYVAPRLAEEASGLLAKITDGTYDEISLGRDLSIRVRIPETQHLQDAPEKSLSQGTVDQIYLALRLAFVHSLNESGEGIPMLLDDPFANYDDKRLATTMALVSGLVGRNQVILFTCRDDVVAAGEAQAASIIRL